MRLQKNCKVGRVFQMVIVSILPKAELGRNDHREDAPDFNLFEYNIKTVLKFIICKYWVESNETLPILPDGTKYELIIEEDFE